MQLKCNISSLILPQFHSVFGAQRKQEEVEMTNPWSAILGKTSYKIVFVPLSASVSNAMEFATSDAFMYLPFGLAMDMIKFQRE